MLTEASKKVTPGRWFRLKMRYRIFKKSLGLRGLRGAHIAQPQHRFRFAGAMMLVLLTLSSGVGAYAYASPDVTVLNPLYPVKQSFESAELYFAGDANVKAKIRLKHAGRRMAEMEILSRELRGMGEIGDANKEEGMRKTLVLMQQNMEQSLQSASEEEKPSVAETVVSELHDDFEQLDEKLGLLEQKRHLKKVKIVSDDVNRVRNFTQKKIQRAEEVRGEIRSALKARKPRVFLNRLTMDETDTEWKPRILEFREEQSEQQQIYKTESQPEVKTEVDAEVTADANIEVDGKLPTVPGENEIKDVTTEIETEFNSDQDVETEIFVPKILDISTMDQPRRLSR